MGSGLVGNRKGVCELATKPCPNSLTSRQSCSVVGELSHFSVKGSEELDLICENPKKSQA